MKSNSSKQILVRERERAQKWFNFGPETPSACQVVVGVVLATKTGPPLSSSVLAIWFALASDQEESAAFWERELNLVERKF